MSTGVFFKRNPDGTFSLLEKPTEQNENNSPDSVPPEERSALGKLRLTPGPNFEIVETAGEIFVLNRKTEPVTLNQTPEAKQEEPKQRTPLKSVDNLLEPGNVINQSEPPTLNQTHEAIKEQPKERTPQMCTDNNLLESGDGIKHSEPPTLIQTPQAIKEEPKLRAPPMSTDNLLKSDNGIKHSPTIITNYPKPTASTSKSASAKPTKSHCQPPKQESLLKIRNRVPPPTRKSGQEMRPEYRNALVHDVIKWSPFSEEIQDLVQSCRPHQRLETLEKIVALL
ncbi:uncharacterized protein LOC6523872 isoform X2 [Drosophila yakuba]|uniref:Uncharacterized protein n=1 Tax=Drosophila yakuba TaxID=7245 RepID=B4PXK1_DROYA|nr:uncharacterized protein LOC6523872 isoform X2 [Drosophila yakuba]EDX00854.2 uncharacterized protein Dyak_GE16548 [Drosophila yakuba]